MSEFVAYRDGGKTSEEGLFKYLYRLFTGGFPIVHSSTTMKAVQRGAGANMSVDVSIGDVHIPTLAGDYSYYGWIDAAVNKTVSASDPSNPRKDIVVAYVDLSIVSSASNNNPGALKFAVVAGTPAGSPADPSDGTIQSAVGASNPWKKIARILVGTGATQVVTGDITDLRTNIAFKGKLWGGSSNTDGHTVPNVADDTVTLLAAAQAMQNKTITASSITASDIAINAPQGFLVNGKVTATVASSNLTVAIKTMAGATPSATDPVYVRIGNTLRSITAALSVTKSAGTNWFGSGGSMFATLEMDYFVYLGYNATDGIVIGFARVPYAHTYGDFSATSTAESYAAISTITTAASTDEYEVVGRFNAILSATASFNWSIPATAVVINRPIFESRFLSYAPTYTGFSVVPSTVVARYQINNNSVLLSVASNSGTSNANSFTISLPFVVKTLANLTYQIPSYTIDNGSAGTGAENAVLSSAGTTAAMGHNDSLAGWTTSGNKSAIFQARYETY